MNLDSGSFSVHVVSRFLQSTLAAVFNTMDNGQLRIEQHNNISLYFIQKVLQNKNFYVNLNIS